MAKINGGKGGRKSARKAQRLARSKPSHIPSVPPSVEIIQTLTLERQKLIFALRGALYFYDRATGAESQDHGWTAKDLAYLGEMRYLAWGDDAVTHFGAYMTDQTWYIELPISRTPIPSVSRPAGSQTAPASYGKPRKPRKTRPVAS
jgi:hypothetical protein